MDGSECSDDARPGQVGVVVIVYNDECHVAEAVESALAQGPAVREVVVVDDCSTDGTADLLAALATSERVTVIRRGTNSGGCGTPRNDGLAVVTAPYVMFLDSDDVLPPGAVDELLPVAHRYDADVVAGRALRRELPGGRTTVWDARPYDGSGAVDPPETACGERGSRPELVRDTLSVNKFYRREFLRRNRITFPAGAFHYEDFVFTARVYAAAPRLVAIDSAVYVWNVRRHAARLSISLRRGDLANWQHRIAAHQGAIEVFRDADRPELTLAAQAKFVDYDMPLYLRELPTRSAEYQRQWWDLARRHLARFDERGLAAAAAPARWAAQAILSSPRPVELLRLVELASPEPRLVPPYHLREGTPVLGPGPAAVPLAGLADLLPAQLPVSVGALVRVGRVTRMRLRVDDLYGRLAHLRPERLTLELTERTGARRPVVRHAPLVAGPDVWRAEIGFLTNDLACPGDSAVWRCRAVIHYADGASTRVEVRAHEKQTARRRLVARRHGPLLVQTHITERRALVLKVAVGPACLWRIALRRTRRLLGRVPAAARRRTGVAVRRVGAAGVQRSRNAKRSSQRSVTASGAKRRTLWNPLSPMRFRV